MSCYGHETLDSLNYLDEFNFLEYFEFQVKYSVRDVSFRGY